MTIINQIDRLTVIFGRREIVVISKNDYFDNHSKKLFVQKFIFRSFCSKIRKLSTSTIHQFADEYSQINRAFKQLPINRRILSHRPTLLQNERVRIQCSAYLLRDNREYEFSSIIENTEGLLKGRNDLLPAEGTIFITNYRVIFHGISKEYDDRNGNILFYYFKGSPKLKNLGTIMCY